MGLDRSALLKWLAERDTDRKPYAAPADLVVASIYAGLADRIRSGQFDTPDQPKN
jgi:hypothetical protein